jgi:hypothetical protein
VQLLFLYPLYPHHLLHHLLLLQQGEAVRPAEADEVALLADEQLAGMSQEALLAHIRAVQEELCGKVRI